MKENERAKRKQQEQLEKVNNTKDEEILSEDEELFGNEDENSPDESNEELSTVVGGTEYIQRSFHSFKARKSTINKRSKVSRYSSLKLKV